MIREKPILDRGRVLDDEARQVRIARQLDKINDLLVDAEELAPPVRRGGFIELQIVRKTEAVVPYRQALELLVGQHA